MKGYSLRKVVRWSISIGIVLLFVGTSIAQVPNMNSLQNKIPENISKGTYTFNPTDDSYVGWPNDVNGDLLLMALRNGSTNDYWLCAGCVKFDISGIPSNASVESASLLVYYYNHSFSNPSGHPIVLHRFNGDWNEETIMRNYMPSWSSEISAVTNLPSSHGAWLTWDVTSDVQSFISGVMENYGWIIKDEHYWGGANIPSPFLYSKEYGSLIPYLEIVLNDNNDAPETPQISGPADGLPGHSYNYTFVSSDPNSDSIYYWIDWDDGYTDGWLGPYNSGQSITIPHTWDNPGEYTIEAKAKDTNGSESSWGTFLVNIINNPPTAPQISGPANGTHDHSYDYTFVSSDPNSDSIYYWIDWDDGYTDGWLGPYTSGQSITIPHTWDIPAVYTIEAKTKDMYGAESSWGTFLVNIINNPPAAPQITGQTNGTTEHSNDYTFITNDPDGDQIYYWIDWGDGYTEEWIGPYTSGQSITIPHTWDIPAVYTIEAKVKDTFGAESSWGTLQVTIGSNPPETPQITGIPNGTVGQSYDYTFITSDPDGDQIYYWIDWGDGQTNQWIGPYNPGQPVTIPHTWAEKGTYTIQAKAKDTYGAESSWGILVVNMPLSSHNMDLHFFENFFEKLFERFSYSFPILRYLLGF
jgi:hypothetical protein